MAMNLKALNPLGKPVGGKSTDVLVGGLLGIAVAALLKKHVVDRFLPANQFVNNFWPVLGGVGAAAALGAVGGKVPGLKKMNNGALVAGALVAAAAPGIYGMVAGKIPGLSETVAVNLQGYADMAGVLVEDTGVSGFGVMTEDAPGLQGGDFDGLAALSMQEEDYDGLADLVQVAM